MNLSGLIYKATVFIHDNFSESLSVADISAQANFSPSYFAAVFRVLTGFTVKNYLNRYRLNRAAEELVASEKRIADIAVDAGFSSQQAFTKSFTKMFGVAPAQFRVMKPDFEPFPPENVRGPENAFA